MDPKKKALLSTFLLKELEDDDDFTLIAAKQQQNNCKISLCLKQQTREKHFRLGHLIIITDDWIEQYLDSDFFLVILYICLRKDKKKDLSRPIALSMFSVTLRTSPSLYRKAVPLS